MEAGLQAGKKSEAGESDPASYGIEPIQGLPRFLAGVASPRGMKLLVPRPERILVE